MDASIFSTSQQVSKAPEKRSFDKYQAGGEKPLTNNHKAFEEESSEKSFQGHIRTEERNMETKSSTKNVVDSDNEVQQQDMEVKPEGNRQEELSDGQEAEEISSLDSDQIRKIEKTVRKLLLESMHLSPEKFTELQHSLGIEKNAISQELKDILIDVEKLVNSLKTIAGKEIDKLSINDIKSAVHMINEFKQIIQNSHQKDLPQKLKSLVSSGTAQELLGNSSQPKSLTNDAKQHVSSAETPIGTSTENEELLGKAKAFNGLTQQPQSSKENGKAETKGISQQVLNNLANKESSANGALTIEKLDATPKENKSRPVGEASSPSMKDKASNKSAPLRGELAHKISSEAPQKGKSSSIEGQDEIMKSVKKFTVEKQAVDVVENDSSLKQKMKQTANNGQMIRQQIQAKADSQNQAESDLASDEKGSKDKSLADSRKPLNFLKKLKSIINKNETSDISLNDSQNTKVNQKATLNFINKLNASNLAKQIVENIQKFIKASHSSKAVIDLQAPGMGDMKVAAEVTGTKLSVNLSSLSQNIRAELIPLRAELNQDLKSLGFDDVELGFDWDGEGSNGRNPFEDKRERDQQKDPVKLPGDYLADLAEISQWLESFNAS